MDRIAKQDMGPHYFHDRDYPGLMYLKENAGMNVHMKFWISKTTRLIVV